MTKQQQATGYFRNRFNCSQSVFTVFGTVYGLDENDCLRCSCAFGGGMGRLQLTCGAVTGGMMALGLKYGKALNDPEDKKTLTYQKARELMDEFKKIHGSVNCRELLDGLDMNDPDDHKKIIERGLFEKRCERYVEDAVSIVERL